MMQKIYTLLLLSLSSLMLYAQTSPTTIGLGWNTEDSYNGYTLLSPISSLNSYLIDNCGHQVNIWEFDSNPAYVSRLMNDGSLLRIGYSSIEIKDWDSNTTWQIPTSIETAAAHSDFALMPNGNIALLANYYLTNEEFEAMGGIPNTTWIWGASLEGIVEIEPIGSDDYNIVWEWWVDDHFIQDIDASKPNFGIISDHAELLDMNHEQIDAQRAASDMHFNSIAYNESLDVFMVSNFTSSEIYMIDRSTSTEEAAEHSGGNFGKGGDFIFRWGNPFIYDRGSLENRLFFSQHDPNWIPESYVNGGMISVHENGNARPDGEFSRAVIINPSIVNGEFQKDSQGRYLPEDFYWSWQGDVNGETFYTQFMGGVDAQANGNILICEGMTGRLFEVNPEGDIVWYYQNPATAFILNQGTEPGATNMYKCQRHDINHPAFVDKDMTAGEILENENEVSEDCMIFENPISTSISENSLETGQAEVYPNPFTDVFYIEHTDEISQYQLTEINGRVVSQGRVNNTLSLADMSSGIYILHLSDDDGQFLYSIKIQKIEK